MRVLVVLSCLLVLAVAISPADFQGARFASRRRRDSTSILGKIPPAKQLDCPAWVAPKGPPAAGAWEQLVEDLYQAAPKDEPRVAFAKGAYAYNAIAFDNTNGQAIAGKAIALPDFDLCKLYPQTVCSQGAIGKLPTSPNAKAWPLNNFCQSSPAAGKMCCPLADAAGKPMVAKIAGPLAKAPGNPSTNGCPKEAKVAGMPRSFMPQIIPPGGQAKLVAYLSAKMNAKIAPQLAVVPMNKVAPTQDEMFLKNSIEKICNAQLNPPVGVAGLAHPVGTAGFFNAGVYTPSALDICGLGLDIKDLYFILDGHHRYSQKALCPVVKGCDYDGSDPAHGGVAAKAAAPWAGAKNQANAEANIYVNIWNAACSDIVRHCLNVMDYTPGIDPKGGAAAGQKPPALSVDLDLTGAAPKGHTAQAKDGANDVGIYFKAGAFAELEAKFGRSRHASRAEATAAYVEETRSRLEEIGVELKGGDQAIAEYFEQTHVPTLWQ